MSPQPPFARRALSQGLLADGRGTGPTLGDASAPPGRWQVVAGDGCCPPPARRARLLDLDRHFHCSVIGTCLGTAALRKLVARHSPAELAQASDLEVHHRAVTLAIEGGAGAKALHKLIDEVHAVTVRQWAALRTAEALLPQWEAALRGGDIPGAYWALMTHPLASRTLRERAFGDVHMLSHLVGAANRADLARLATLRADNTALQEQLQHQQQRHRAALDERDQQLARLQQQVAALGAAVARPAADADAVAALRQALDEARAQAALHDQRRAAVQAERDALAGLQADTQGRLDRALAALGDLHQEQRALEDELTAGGRGDGTAAAGDIVSAAAGPAATAAPPISPLRRGLQGRSLLYVGGRPSSLLAIRALVLASGGQWLHHDGGLEDRKGLLAAVLPRADMVVFPVDCIDHDAMHTLKRLCMRHGRPYRPLRSASVASFVAALARPAGEAPLANGAALASPFCLRHG